LSRISFEDDVKQRNVDGLLNPATPRYVENAGFYAGRKGSTEQIEERVNL
jgi:hypothetical protein